MGRKVKDRLTVEMFQKMPVKQQVKLLNSRLSYYHQQNNVSSELRFIEKRLFEDAFVSLEFSQVRKELNIYTPLSFDEYENNPEIVENWLICQISGKNLGYGDEEYDTYSQKITDATARLLDKLVLPNGWFAYIQAYLALDRLPTSTEVERDPPISVDAIEENEIVVRMERGLKPDDYAVAWKALKPFFRQPNIYLSGATIKDRIHLDRKRGMGISAIAKKYYPKQYNDNPDVPRDLIKKTLSRYKKSSQ